MKRNKKMKKDKPEADYGDEMRGGGRAPQRKPKAGRA
jgi:hypothetical protein